MIDSKALLEDLQRLLPSIEADISQYAEQQTPIQTALEQQYQSAKDAERTAEHWVDWRAALVTQSAVAWVLACVFIRFLEDNKLMPHAVIAGPEGERLDQAKDAQTVYFREHPTHAEREYLQHQFERLSKLPVMAALLDKNHNPLWAVPVSADGAKALLDFFQKIDPDTGATVHNFTDKAWHTRFLGDLYQDLSLSVRKRYALLQTPDFVEAFILDYTLKPAMQTFGIKGLRMIDPTCGSGHFLLSGFNRLFDAWLKQEPQTNTRELAQRALSAVHGIDINPYAVAIARFRLLIAAMQAAGSSSIHQTPDFTFNLAVGDSLIHGRRHEYHAQGIQTDALDDPIGHVLDTEDKVELDRILGQRFHVVVGNPPYITVKDKALNAVYRQKYPTCHRQYSLGVPFTERFFDLTIQEPVAGYLGMITTNSFMKREFGKKLIEEYFPEKDLTHVIDTSGAYIPGHGTPTVILYARNRKPVQDMVRAILGIRGEPSTPDDPAKGKVWSSVVGLLNQPGSENEFVSSVDQDRTLYGAHPWSLTGGGATELKAILDTVGAEKLGNIQTKCGRYAHTGADDAYFYPRGALSRYLSDKHHRIPLVEGAEVRDWSLDPGVDAVFPYDSSLEAIKDLDASVVNSVLWAFKSYLRLRREPGGTHEEIGLTWFEWSRWHPERYSIPLGITFAEVASHNHFVLDRGGKVFKQTAPVIKLSADASENDHLVLLGLLNSSTACFWMKQVFHNKGEGADSQGARQTGERAFDFYQFAGTGLKYFPVPDRPNNSLLNLATKLDELAQNKSIDLLSHVMKNHEPKAISDGLRDLYNKRHSIRGEMIALQEELDWESYAIYGCIDERITLPVQEAPEVQLGERAFEIVLARKIRDDGYTTSWFERNETEAQYEIPTHWPADYQQLVQKRIDAIENNKSIRLIEQPEYKRRWATDSWEDKVAEASREYLLDTIEERSKNHAAQLHTAAQLANQLQSDTRFQQVAEVYTGTNTFNLQDLVTDLITDEQVPQMATARYKAKGMTKFRAWQETWAMQRREDAGETLDIAVPPKYASSDFAKPGYWKHRGKLDVPKERFFSLPFCEKPGDTTPVIGWAGLDHLQRATAIATWYLERKENDGWEAAQLLPMLNALDELIPWLKQWHNDIDPEYNERMGDYYESFLNEEIRSLGTTIAEVQNWIPPAAISRTRKKTIKKKKAKSHT